MSNNADWFARKMANRTPQQPSLQQPPYVPPLSANTPLQTSQQFAMQQPGMPQLPMIPSQPQSKAQSAQQTASCPSCGSANYMSVQNAAARCFDCGYPTEQSGSRYGALTGAKVDSAAAKPAVGNSSGGYHPDQIIGKVG